MPQARVGEDRDDVGDEVQPDVDGGEDQTAGLHHRHVAFGDMVDEVLTHAGIGEDHLDHDHADDEIGHVEHDHVDDGGDGVGEGVLADHREHAQALELGGFDIGRLHHVEDGGAGHAHHVRQHHEGEHEDRQGDGLDLVDQAHAVVDQRHGGEAQVLQEPALHAVAEEFHRLDQQGQLDRQQEDQDVADHEFGNGDGRQRDRGDQLVGPAVLVAHREEAEGDRQRHRDQRGPEGEKERVLEPSADAFGDVAPVGERGAEVTLQDAAEPAEIARHRRVVQAQFGAQVGERLGGGRLAEDLLRHVPGQHHRAPENQDRRGEKQQEAQRETLGHQFYDRVHRATLTLSMCA